MDEEKDSNTANQTNSKNKCSLIWEVNTIIFGVVVVIINIRELLEIIISINGKA